jgi:hypothetical protein
MSATKKQINEELNNQELVQLPAVMPVSTSSVALGTLQASNPAALVSGAAELASQLAIVINRQNLATVIKGKRFVNVEGWTTLATMLGVTAREVCTVELEGVYVATVELVRMSDGACISRASAECGSSDELDKYGKPIWSTRPRYARRSMAQTRATGKACRLAFSWIMSLAGYEVTPAEEMTPIIEAEQVQERPAPTQRKTKTQTQTQTAESVSSTVPEPPAPIDPPEPQRITASQQKLLEAQIRDYGLDRERVKAWLHSAWKVEHFQDLSPKQFETLLKRLETWASQEYAKAEAASALSRNTANF